MSCKTVALSESRQTCCNTLSRILILFTGKNVVRLNFVCGNCTDI